MHDHTSIQQLPYTTHMIYPAQCVVRSSFVVHQEALQQYSPYKRQKLICEWTYTLPKRNALPCWPRNAYQYETGRRWDYSRHKVICTCEMGLTFTATIDFVAIEIGKVLETLELTLLIDREIGDKGFCRERTILSPRK